MTKKRLTPEREYEIEHEYVDCRPDPDHAVMDLLDEIDALRKELKAEQLETSNVIAEYKEYKTYYDRIFEKSIVVEANEYSKMIEERDALRTNLEEAAKINIKNLYEIEELKNLNGAFKYSVDFTTIRQEQLEKERDALKVENEELKAIAKQNKETWTPLAKELCDARKENEELKTENRGLTQNLLSTPLTLFGGKSAGQLLEENEKLKNIVKAYPSDVCALYTFYNEENRTLKQRIKELEDLDYYLEDNKDLMDDLAALERAEKELKREDGCPCGSETSKGCSVTGCPLIEE